MGIGPKGSSLLSKLRLKPLGEMSDEELQTLVSADRSRRSQQRVLGRAKRIMKRETKTHREVTLESIGLAPRLIEKLRESKKSDSELIEMLREREII